MADAPAGLETDKQKELYGILRPYFNEVDKSKSDQDVADLAVKFAGRTWEKLYASLQKKYGKNPMDDRIANAKKKVKAMSALTDGTAAKLYSDKEKELQSILKPFFNKFEPNRTESDIIDLCKKFAERTWAKVFSKLEKTHGVNPMDFKNEAGTGAAESSAEKEETKPEADPAPEPEPEPASKAKAEPEPESKPAVESKPEPEPEPEPEPQKTGPSPGEIAAAEKAERELAEAKARTLQLEKEAEQKLEQERLEKEKRLELEKKALAALKSQNSLNLINQKDKLFGNTRTKSKPIANTAPPHGKTLNLTLSRPKAWSPSGSKKNSSSSPAREAQPYLAPVEKVDFGKFAATKR